MDQNGSIDGYGLDTTAGTFGKLSGFTPPTIPANAGGGGMVVAQNQFVYAIFPEAGIQELFGWSKNKSGNLTLMSGFPISLLSLSSITQFTYNQQVLITNPAGTLLFISEFGDNQILVYQIASNGALTLAPGSPFSTVPAGLEPQNMAMDGKGKFLYVMEDSIDHSGSFVVGYSVSNTGLLTQIPGNWGNSIPIWEMVGDPDGLFMIGITGKVQFLFGSSDKNLYVYSIDQNTGALTAAVGSPHTTINTPFNLAMQPTSSGGEFVYSFSVNDSGIGYNNIEGFQLNPGTAALTEVTGSPFAGLTPSPWGQFDPSGAFLFIYAGTSPNFTMGVLTVNSGGGLGQAVANTNLATSGYWAVADIP